MKALRQGKYGSPDFLETGEVDEPIPGKHQVLIKIHAVSINDWDWGLLNGTPFIPNRLIAGLLKPRIIVGSDIAVNRLRPTFLFENRSHLPFSGRAKARLTVWATVTTS